MAKYEKVGEIYRKKESNGCIGIVVAIVIILIMISQCG